MKAYLLWLLPPALLACTEKVKEPEPEKNALVITTSEFVASPEGQDLQLSLQANVTVRAVPDVDWISVTPASKAMVGKSFTMNVSANESGAARVGHVTFTAGVVSQRVTVSQGALSLTRFNALGFYLGDNQERVYTAGSDQLFRSYSGSALSFAILDMAGREQLKATGYSTSMQVGDAVPLSVEWKVDRNTTLSQVYEMKVIKDEGGKVWIGDIRGRGVILKK